MSGKVLRVGVVVVALGAVGVVGVNAGTDGAALVNPTIENGDWNGDGRRDISDVIGLFRFMFAGGVPAVPIECSGGLGDSPQDGSQPSVRNGDLDGDGRLTITDGIRYVQFLFIGGPPPAEVVCLSESDGP